MDLRGAARFEGEHLAGSDSKRLQRRSSFREMQKCLENQARGGFPGTSSLGFPGTYSAGTAVKELLHFVQAMLAPSAFAAS